MSCVTFIKSVNAIRLNYCNVIFALASQCKGREILSLRRGRDAFRTIPNQTEMHQTVQNE